ncbi:hypothetical protein MRX96_021655 [Rhipicephalus microplus]
MAAFGLSYHQQRQQGSVSTGRIHGIGIKAFASEAAFGLSYHQQRQQGSVSTGRIHGIGIKAFASEAIKVE